MKSYIGNEPIAQAAGFRHEVYATAGQTDFVVGYAPGYLDVFKNGVKLGVDDFTATDGATVTLAQGAAANDLIAFIAWARGTMAPVTDFVLKAGDTMTGPLIINPSASGFVLDLRAPPTGDSNLMVRGNGEGGEIRLANADASKSAAIDLIQATNMMRVYHAMGGTTRIWEFRSNGCMSTQNATASDEAVPLGQGDARYARLATANTFTGNQTVKGAIVIQPTVVEDNGPTLQFINPRNWGVTAGFMYGFSGTWTGLAFSISNSTQFFSLRGDGYGYAPVGWSPASDGRVKVDRIEIDDALTKLSALTGYTYRRTDTGNDTRRGGLIAQDVEAVLAEAVSVMGSSNEHQPEDMKALDYNAVIALLVNAVKELKSRVEALEA